MRALLALLWAAALLPQVPARAQTSYSIAITPQYENRQLFAIWKPIVAELEKRTGLTLKLVARFSLDEFEHEFAKGAPDFAYVNPYLVVREYGNQGYIPLVRDRAPIRGILVVRKDSPIRTPADLNGKTVAFPSPNALGAGLLLRADLDQLFNARVKGVYVRTHNSSYMHVVNALTDAGGGTDKTLQEQSAAIRDALRVLYTTREAPSLPLAAHPRVPKEDREKIRRALLALASSPEGKLLLDKVPMPNPVAADIGEYLAMRSWNLDAYWVKEF